MSSDSEGSSDKEHHSNSDDDSPDNAPTTWQPPSMSETMRKKMELSHSKASNDSSRLNAEFVSSFSRFSSPDKAPPPPVPPKSFKQKPEEDQSLTSEVSNMEINREGGDNQSNPSVKDQIRMFEGKETPNPFAALKQSPENLDQQATKTSLASQGSMSEENSSDIYASAREIPRNDNVQDQQVPLDPHTESKTHQEFPNQGTTNPGPGGQHQDAGPYPGRYGLSPGDIQYPPGGHPGYDPHSAYPDGPPMSSLPEYPRFGWNMPDPMWRGQPPANQAFNPRHVVPPQFGYGYHHGPLYPRYDSPYVMPQHTPDKGSSHHGHQTDENPHGHQIAPSETTHLHQTPVGKGDKSKSNVKPGKKRPQEPTKKQSPTKQNEPEKMYVCVSGIPKNESNDTLYNYLEARSKKDIVREESLRTDEDLTHAVVVFSDMLDLNELTKNCQKKKLKNSDMIFEEGDNPRTIIASSEDTKLTSSSFRSYLTKKNLGIVRVNETEEGAVTAKLKNTKGVTEVLKTTNIKIDGSSVVVSVMYLCEHGTFYDSSLHRVAIPAPFKPTTLDKHVKSFIIDITSICDEHLEPYHARLSTMDEIHIECTLDSKDREARKKVKTWKDDVQKAWEEFVRSNAHKKHLQVTHDTKNLLVEHINSIRERHSTEELQVIHDDEDMLTIIFIGKSNIVEKFYDQAIIKKKEIAEKLERESKIKTDSMHIKPLEIALLDKEKKFDELKSIADDFKFKIDQENGSITFTGVSVDINTAKVKIFQAKADSPVWTIDSLSQNKCKILKNEIVQEMVIESFGNKNISAVFEIKDGKIDVCTTNKNQRQVENIFKEMVDENEITLDDTSKNILLLDEWAEKKTSLKSLFQDLVEIDDSANNKIVVIATTSVIDDVKENVEKFVKEHSIYEDTISVREEPQYKYLENHCNDFFKDLMFQDKDLQIDFGNQKIKIKGTKKAMETARSQITAEIQKIKKDQHTIKRPGVDSLFSDQKKSDDITMNAEEDSKTVIVVDQTSLTKTPTRRNAGSRESHEDYVLHQTSTTYSRKDSKRKSGQSKPKSGPVVFPNGTKVVLGKKEEIGRQKADVIICSTNASLDMTGAAGKSLVQGAGTQIVDEIKNNYKEGIKHGEIAVVNGHKLSCKEVYLAALPGWSAGGEKIITKCVETCLNTAIKYKSVVFPALGTGNLHYPRELVAQTMYQCVKDFDKKNTSVKEIKFLCYDGDTIKAFEREELRQLNPGYNPPPVVSSSHGPYKKHNLSVSIVKGDLGKQKVDAMVSAVPADLNLESAGGSGISIMKGLGQTVQQDICNTYPNGIKSGDFAVVKLSAPTGKCKSVYLTSLEPWSQQQSIKDGEKQICKFVYNCLEAAEKDGYKSIAIPAMGTGKIGYPHDKVATFLYDMAEKFANNHKHSKLTDVKFVVHFKDSSSIQAFESEEKNRLPPPPPVPQTGSFGFATRDTSPDSATLAVNVKSVSDSEFEVGKLSFSVESGDILSKTCDAIVNGSNEALDFDRGGAVSQAIKKKCDAKKLLAECANKKDSMKQHNVVSTSGCGLPAKFIIHIVSKHNPYGWKKMIKKALHKAEKKKCQTLALPALGTGRADVGGLEQELMGKAIMESVKEFVGEGKFTHLKHVFLVVFQDQMVKSMLRGVKTAAQNVSSRGKPQHVTKSPSQQGSSVSFLIYSTSTKDIDNAKKLLDQVVSEQYKTETIHERLLSEIRPKELSYLESVGDDFPIKLTIDTVKSEITMEGIVEHIVSAKQQLFDWLGKFTHMRHCEAEAEIIKEQAQWYFKDIDNDTGLMSLKTYPPMINMHLENAYKGNSSRSDVDFKDEKGVSYIIDLKTMTEYPANNPNDTVDVIRREKLEAQGGTFEPPADWVDQGTENIKVVTILNTSQEYKTIEQKLVDSVKNGTFTKTSPDVRNKKLTVTKIERVQNLNLFRMYAAKRSLMEKQNLNVKNERELWHGTPESAVVSINYYGFNRSYCMSNSQGAWWGEGVYFASDASYSVRDFLTRPGASPSQERSIYLCLVLTGVCRPGVKHERLRYLPLRRDGSMLPYDSNTDDLNPPIEYVIFNDTQAYPLYRIKFTLI